MTNPMNIEQHIPSLATCKRMKKMGWKKETYLEWDSDMQGNYKQTPTRVEGIKMQVPTQGSGATSATPERDIGGIA